MATTINAYKVSLSLDAGQYISASSLSRSETNRLKKEIEGARTPAENYTLSLNRLDKALKEGAISQGTHTRLVENAKRQMQGAANATGQYAGFVSSIKTGLAGIVGYHAIKSLVGDSVLLAAEAESAAIQFEVLTGSVKESADMVAGLRQLAATTPLTLRDTQAAAKTMMSFGVASESILPTLKMLGDVTGGNSERFKMMALAFSQTAAAGRMMGQDLLQMINAGFNPLQQISKMTGESMLDLKKRMEAGAISASEVANAFRAATSEGGMFFGMIDRMAGTTEGKLAKLTDAVSQLKIATGEAVEPVTDWVLDDLNKKISDLTFGMQALARGGMPGIRANEAAALADIRQQQFFANRQLRRKREGLPVEGPQATTAAEMNNTASKGIESLIGSSISAIESMSSTVLNGLSTFQQAAESIAMVGVANTQELVKSMKEDPIVTGAIEGTQEAYEALTQAAREADRASRLEALRKQQLDENAAKQRDTMNMWLDRINTSLVNHGLKRIR